MFRLENEISRRDSRGVMKNILFIAYSTFCVLWLIHFPDMASSDTNQIQMIHMCVFSVLIYHTEIAMKQPTSMMLVWKCCYLALCESCAFCTTIKWLRLNVCASRQVHLSLLQCRSFRTILRQVVECSWRFSRHFRMKLSVILISRLILCVTGTRIQVVLQ